MSFNVKGIMSKLKSNAPKIGSLYGYVGAFQIEYGNDINAIIQHIINGVTHPTFDINTVLARLQHGAHAPILKNGVLVYLAGEFLGNVQGFNLKKIGENIVMADIASAFLWGGTDNTPNPTNRGHSSVGNSPSWGYNS